MSAAQRRGAKSPAEARAAALVEEVRDIAEDEGSPGTGHRGTLGRFASLNGSQNSDASGRGLRAASSSGHLSARHDADELDSDTDEDEVDVSTVLAAAHDVNGPRRQSIRLELAQGAGGTSDTTPPARQGGSSRYRRPRGRGAGASFRHRRPGRATVQRSRSARPVSATGQAEQPTGTTGKRHGRTRTFWPTTSSRRGVSPRVSPSRRETGRAARGSVGASTGAGGGAGSGARKSSSPPRSTGGSREPSRSPPATHGHPSGQALVGTSKVGSTQHSGKHSGRAVDASSVVSRSSIQAILMAKRFAQGFKKRRQRLSVPVAPKSPRDGKPAAAGDGSAGAEDGSKSGDEATQNHSSSADASGTDSAGLGAGAMAQISEAKLSHGDEEADAGNGDDDGASVADSVAVGDPKVVLFLNALTKHALQLLPSELRIRDAFRPPRLHLRGGNDRFDLRAQRERRRRRAERRARRAAGAAGSDGDSSSDGASSSSSSSSSSSGQWTTSSPERTAGSDLEGDSNGEGGGHKEVTEAPPPLLRLDLNVAKLRLNVDLFTRAMPMFQPATRVVELNLAGTRAEGLGAGVNALTALKTLRISADLTRVASFRRQHHRRQALASPGGRGSHVVALPRDRSPPPSPVDDHEEAAATFARHMAQLRSEAKAAAQASATNDGGDGDGEDASQLEQRAQSPATQRKLDSRVAIATFTRAGSSASLYDPSLFPEPDAELDALFTPEEKQMLKYQRDAAASDALSLLQSHARTRYITALCYNMRDVCRLEVFAFTGQGLVKDGHSGIADGAVQALARFVLRNAGTLRHLDMSDNHIGASGITILGHTLNKFPPSAPLRYLDFGGNSNRSQRVHAYAQFWRRGMEAKQRKVKVDGFDLTKEHSLAVLTLLPETRHLTITRSNTRHIMALLPSKLATTVRLAALDLTRNNVNDAELECLVNALRQNDSLTSLKVKNNPITQRSVDALCHMLQTCALCGLRDVDLHDNTLQVVLRCRREFFSKRVDLHDSHLTQRDLDGLGVMIQRATRMRSLDLSSNNLGTRGIAVVVASLIAGIENETSRLTELDLSETGLDDAGCKFLARLVEVHPSLKKLNIQDNNIGDRGAQLLAQASLRRAQREEAAKSAGARHASKLLQRLTKLYNNGSLQAMADASPQPEPERRRKNPKNLRLQALDASDSEWVPPVEQVASPSAAANRILTVLKNRDLRLAAGKPTYTPRGQADNGPSRGPRWRTRKRKTSTSAKPKLRSRPQKVGIGKGWALLRRRLGQVRRSGWSDFAKGMLVEVSGNESMSDDMVHAATGRMSLRARLKMEGSFTPPPPGVETKHWVRHMVDPDIGGVIATHFGASLLMSRVHEIKETIAGRLRALAAATRRRAALKHRGNAAAAEYFLTEEQQEELKQHSERQTLESIRQAKRKIMEVELSMVTKAGRQVLPSCGSHVMPVGNIVRVKSSTEELTVGVDGAVLELQHGLHVDASNEEALKVLFFKGYPQKGEDMKDHYHWTVVNAAQCRNARSGTLQAHISECGYYTAAWDWACGPPQQKVHVLAFGPTGWGAADGTAPLAVYVVPLSVDPLLYNRTVRHLCEVLATLPKSGGLPMSYAGGTPSTRGCEHGLVVELGRPIVIRLGGVEHCIPKWDGVAQCVQLLPIPAPCPNDESLSGVVHIGVISKGSPRASPRKTPRRSPRRSPRKSPRVSATSSRGRTTKMWGPVVETDDDVVYEVTEIGSLSFHIPIVQRLPSMPTNFGLEGRRRTTTLFFVDDPSPYDQANGPARPVVYVKSLEPGEYTQAGSTSRPAGRGRGKRKCRQSLAGYQRVPFAWHQGRIEIPNLFYSALVTMTYENVFGETAAAPAVMVHPSNQCIDLRFTAISTLSKAKLMTDGVSMEELVSRLLGEAVSEVTRAPDAAHGGEGGASDGRGDGSPSVSPRNAKESALRPAALTGHDNHDEASDGTPHHPAMDRLRDGPRAAPSPSAASVASPMGRSKRSLSGMSSPALGAEMESRRRKAGGMLLAAIIKALKPSIFGDDDDGGAQDDAANTADTIVQSLTQSVLPRSRASSIDSGGRSPASRRSSASSSRRHSRRASSTSPTARGAGLPEIEATREPIGRFVCPARVPTPPLLQRKPALPEKFAPEAWALFAYDKGYTRLIDAVSTQLRGSPRATERGGLPTSVVALDPMPGGAGASAPGAGSPLQLSPRQVMQGGAVRALPAVLQDLAPQPPCSSGLGLSTVSVGSMSSFLSPSQRFEAMEEAHAASGVRQVHARSTKPPLEAVVVPTPPSTLPAVQQPPTSTASNAARDMRRHSRRAKQAAALGSTSTPTTPTKPRLGAKPHPLRPGRRLKDSTESPTTKSAPATPTAAVTSGSVPLTPSSDQSSPQLSVGGMSPARPVVDTRMPRTVSFDSVPSTGSGRSSAAGTVRSRSDRWLGMSMSSMAGGAFRVPQEPMSLRHLRMFEAQLGQQDEQEVDPTARAIAMHGGAVAASAAAAAKRAALANSARKGALPSTAQPHSDGGLVHTVARGTVAIMAGDSSRTLLQQVAPASSPPHAAPAAGSGAGSDAKTGVSSMADLATVVKAAVSDARIVKALVPPPFGVPWTYTRHIRDTPLLQWRGSQPSPAVQATSKAQLRGRDKSPRISLLGAGGGAGSGDGRGRRKMKRDKTGRLRPVKGEWDMLTSADLDDAPEHMVHSVNRDRLTASLGRSSISDKSLKRVLGVGMAGCYDLVRQRFPEYLAAPHIALILAALRKCHTTARSAKVHRENALQLVDFVARAFGTTRGGLAWHYGEVVSLLNELLAQLCDLQRFLRQFSRRGWLRFVTHSAHITEDFEHFEQSIADVFTSHLGTQLPALRGAVRNLALRNMYMDETAHKSLTVQYFELMVLADQRQSSDAVVVPSGRMMKEACKQLALPYVADNRAEVSAQLRYLKRHDDAWEGDLHINLPGPDADMDADATPSSRDTPTMATSQRLATVVESPGTSSPTTRTPATATTPNPTPPATTPKAAATAQPSPTTPAQGDDGTSGSKLDPRSNGAAAVTRRTAVQRRPAPPTGQPGRPRPAASTARLSASAHARTPQRPSQPSPHVTPRGSSLYAPTASTAAKVFSASPPRKARKTRGRSRTRRVKKRA